MTIGIEKSTSSSSTVIGSGRLEGRRALITGASRGIGRAIAERFVTEGARVCIAARNVENLREVAESIEAEGGQTSVVHLDASDRQSCLAAVEATVEEFGGLDIMVNSAAIYIPRKFVDYTPEEFDQTLKTNLYGAFYLMQAAIRQMQRAQAGKIINIASSAGRWASKNQAAYNISKHGMIGMTRCAALEYAPEGISVNAICPGMVKTDLSEQLYAEQAAIQNVTPEEMRNAVLARVANGSELVPEDIAHLAVYLASKESDGMTGQALSLDAGMLFK